MKLIIDTDMGIDDAVALLMILAHPHAEIEAITSVLGNVSLAQATHNIGVVLDLAQAPAIPIYRGCSRPLMQNKPLDATDVHAADGLGGAGRAQTHRIVEDEHAGLALIRLAHEKPGQRILLTLGPLTNIALAIRLAPNFLHNFDRIVLMAGAVEGRGNTSPVAEFNVAVDPEAAHIVFDACRDIADKVWLVSWETSLTHATPFDRWRQLIAGDSATAKFVLAMTVYIEQAMARNHVTVIPWADPLAAAVALAPDIVLNYERRSVEVEVGQNMARGQTITDYLSRRGTIANMTIVKDIDQDKFEDLMRMIV